MQIFSHVLEVGFLLLGKLVEWPFLFLCMKKYIFILAYAVFPFQSVCAWAWTWQRLVGKPGGLWFARGTCSLLWQRLCGPCSLPRSLLFLRCTMATGIPAIASEKQRRGEEASCFIETFPQCSMFEEHFLNHTDSVYTPPDRLKTPSCP